MMAVRLSSPSGWMNWNASTTMRISQSISAIVREKPRSSSFEGNQAVLLQDGHDVGGVIDGSDRDRRYPPRRHRVGRWPAGACPD